MSATATKRRFFAPEVVQTSAMDCGPATLKCLLEGFGIPISYGRLREACQTDVDGTSIDTIEDVAVQLGLEAEQIMLPVDHVLMRESDALPALIVVQQPNGLTHFVVLWRTHGCFVQVMDPALGRRWMTREKFLQDVYLHSLEISAADWREWAVGEQFASALRRRMTDLGVPPAKTDELIAEAQRDEGWRTLAVLDAAVRMTASVCRSGGLRHCAQATGVLQSFFDATRKQSSEEKSRIPANYWSAQAALSKDGAEQVSLKGVVLVRVTGRKPQTRAESTEAASKLSPELVAALAEAPMHPARELWKLLRADGWLGPAALFVALFLAATGLMFEAVLFRTLFDIGRDLALTTQRLIAILGICAFALLILFLEWPLVSGLLRMGRQLEIRLRVAFLEKIPRLTDRYLQSRLMSDMAERSHTTHWIRQMPYLSGWFMLQCFELLLTTAGIIWLDPRSTPLVIAAALASGSLPWLLNKPLVERDLRVRTHVGALSRFYLDALLGLIPIRAHGAQRAVRNEHESLLVEWARASLGLQRIAVTGEALQLFAGFGLAAWLLFAHLQRGGEVGTMLLLVYWALKLPTLGQEISVLARQYPMQRNLTLRLLEPLGAPEEKDELSDAVSSSLARESNSAGVAIQFDHLTVRAAGHIILEDINVEISAGSHVGIVGPSGAGKSSFVGLLLGWHRAASGRVLVDGEELSNGRLDALRRATAWVDPTVQLWNQSMLGNLRYGVAPEAELSFGQAIEQAELLNVLKRMPEGLQTALGESGGLLSGGEGQRVRFARAILRPDVRLVILDEPFRGLDREQRRELLVRARKVWANATLLCITHDVSETQSFDRVLVIESGKLIEAENPAELLRRQDSRYARMIEAEADIRQTLWSNSTWRRLRLENGRVAEPTREAAISA